MNFVDFLIFLARFFLANMVQLYCQPRDNEISLSGCSKVTRHLIFNFASIQKIALKMKSTEGVIGNHGFFLDLKDTLEGDLEFFKLCNDVGRIYGMINEQQNWNRDPKKALVVDILEYSSSICNLEDFVKFIDNAVAKLGNVWFEEKKLLSA